jgi:mycothiol synthase
MTELRAAPFRTATPLPDGIALRRLDAPADYRPMNEIANRIRAATGQDFYTTLEQFAIFYEHPSDFEPSADVVVVARGDEVIGYARAGTHDELDGTQVYEVVAFLEPEVVGNDVFVEVVAAVEGRLREIAATRPPGERLFATFGGDEAPERDALLRSRGYQPVRWFYSMVRPDLDDLPDSPLPAGLEIREVTAEQLPVIWAAEQEAFRDHWGFTESNDEEYEQFRTDPVRGDTTLWRIAWDGDEVAGQVRSFINAEENERFGRQRGHVEHISVRRPWRKRGLARALIAASIPLLRERGMTEGALGVDADNPSGALRLYEACGFRPVHRAMDYRRPFDCSDGCRARRGPPATTGCNAGARSRASPWCARRARPGRVRLCRRASHRLADQSRSWAPMSSSGRASGWLPRSRRSISAWRLPSEPTSS